VNEFLRRDFLRLAAAGVLWPASAAEGEPAVRLTLRFRTDAERLSRVLPPPLEADEPVVRVDAVIPAHAAKALVSVSVEARFGDRAGRFPLIAWTNDERTRVAAREAHDLNVRAAEVRVNRQDGRLRIAVERAGKVLCEIEAPKSEAVDSKTGDFESTTETLFAFRTGLRPDWTVGLLDDRPVEWQALSATVPLGEAIDVEQVRLAWGEASRLEPVAELPIEDIFDARVVRLDSAPDPAELRAEKLGESNPAELAPWAFLRYGRPLFDGRLAGPRAEGASDWRLGEGEIEKHQARKELVLNPLELVEVEALIDADIYASLLPEPCRPLSRPSVKLVGLRVNRSDFSDQPFSEIWLLTFCLIGGQAAWYALSHIVGPGGDVVFGREVFGYPSKRGEPEVVVSPVDFSLSVRRGGRELAYAAGGFRGFSTGVSLARLAIAGLRLDPGRDGEPRGGELVAQMWHYQGRRHRIAPGGLQFEFPEPPEGAAPNDPWHKLGRAQILAISAMDGAVMQRSPGQVIARVGDFDSAYRERCDGVLPWQDLKGAAEKPTLLLRQPPQRRSAAPERTIKL